MFFLKREFDYKISSLVKQETVSLKGEKKM